MKKLLSYALIAFVLLAMLFTLTGCGNETTVDVVEDINEEVNVEEDVVEEEDIDLENVSFDGVYVGTKEEDNMEGLIIIPDGEDKLVLIKDLTGTGNVRVGKENITGNYMEKDLLNETFRITDAGENVKFTHPVFTWGEEVELVPATGEFCGVYQNETNYLIIFKNFKDEMTVAYMESKFDNAFSVTMAEYTVNENVIEGNEDSYDEPIKMTFDGDKVTFNIVSEDQMWNRANLEYIKVK